VINFTRDVLDAAPADELALVELARDGSRREWSFGEVSERSARLAGELGRRGVGRGEIVMTLIGNRPEWVFALAACFRLGAVVLPCTEQLRAKDLRLRLDRARPALVIADERDRAELEAAKPECPVLLVPDEALFRSRPVRPSRSRGGASLLSAAPPPCAELDAGDPALITFTSGTAGEPKAVVHAQRYLAGQRLQATSWLGARRGELVWCTASSGWSKSARNVFIAPWLCGAAALLHDARFDASERVALLARERVNVLCMAPTEYRVIAKRVELRPMPALRSMVAAGEALDPHVLDSWLDATGLAIRDGYGQTETGQLTGMPSDTDARHGSMGLPLPGVRLSIERGELVADPATVPTFFLGYLGEGATHDEGGAAWSIRDRRERGFWRTGDRVHADAEGFLYFEGRTDDVIISAGYRIGPFEVESALVSHPAVAEAAAVPAPDEERGAVVRAVVVLQDGHRPSPQLASELQEHVKRTTAPYKYPRIVDFASELPKTASGKVRRAALRD
jgi:acyl-coenzyme A synthetase/AMP-(fatty) acid ligase